MADIASTVKVMERKDFTAVAGERLVVQVVDVNGVVRVVVYDGTVPTGKTFNGIVAIMGDLV